MKFPYVNYGGYFTPTIPVTLSIGDRCIVTEALVDSGAASCIFDAQFAEALGIDDIEEDGKPAEFQGISGDILRGYRHEVTLEVGGRKFHDIEIAFSRDMPDNVVNILGQEGFFAICPIKFTYSKKEIDIMV